MTLKKLFRLLTFMELIQLLVYRTGLRISRLSGYADNCSIVVDEIQQLHDLNYKISRKGKLYCINSAEDNDKFYYLLRPGSTDIKVFQQVIVNKEYIPLLKLINDKSQTNAIKKIVDAGSNIGLVTLFFKLYYLDAQIISIEPDADNYLMLKKNIELNNFKSSVKILKNAFWKNNTDKLTITNEFRGGGSWAKSVVISKRATQSFVHPLTITDIKNVFGENSIIDILKIDIEGSEVELFNSNEFIDVLKKSVRFLCIEIHDELGIREDIYKLFEKINFTFFEAGETCFCVNNNLS